MPSKLRTIQVPKPKDAEADDDGSTIGKALKGVAIAVTRAVAKPPTEVKTAISAGIRG